VLVAGCRDTGSHTAGSADRAAVKFEGCNQQPCIVWCKSTSKTWE